MNFLLGLLFGFLLGDRRDGSGSLPVPGGLPGGTPPNPFPFPIPPFPGTTPGPAPTGTKPGATNTSNTVPFLPGLLPGIIPANFPWGQPAPAGSTPTGGGTIPWTTPTTAIPVPAVRTYTIKSGDYGSGLAQKATGNGGRWKELLASNPEMTTYTDSKGQTQIKPWAVGQKIVVPPGWNL